MRKHWKKIVLIIALLILIILAVAACSSGLGRSEDPSETTLPTAETTVPAAETTAPIEETTAPTEESTPPVENATAPTEPEATEPPMTEPPATEPPATEPPAAESSATEAPNVEHTHNFTCNSKEATCSTDGYATYTCGCSYSYTEVIQATGHNWSGWSVTTQPTADAEGVESRKCNICGVAVTRSIAKLPAESNPPATEVPKQEPAETNPPATEPPATETPSTEPVGCAHEWEMIYHPEEGHYGESYLLCACGARFSTDTEWLNHVKGVPGADAVLYHASYGDAQDWIIDSPKYCEWVCSNCGASTLTEP